MSMMTEHETVSAGLVHVIRAAELTTEYAVVYRGVLDTDDTLISVDHPDDAPEVIADLFNNFGITATLTYRVVSARKALPAVGDTVRYSGRREAKHGEYTVTSTCKCTVCVAGEVGDRFEIRKPNGSGLSHVHGLSLEILA